MPTTFIIAQKTSSYMIARPAINVSEISLNTRAAVLNITRSNGGIIIGRYIPIDRLRDVYTILLIIRNAGK